MGAHKTTPWFVLNAPELGKAFMDFRRVCEKGGVLDRKTKELLMLVMACASRSAYNAEEHLRGAFEAGATKEEITEALMIAAGEDAGAQLTWNRQIVSKYFGNGKP